ncbi:hypothetical protein CXG81DRAFT_20255 [Caulochytrium protostelioides]|uniref:IFT121 second beta-propeller domain-containing protein n=1 Tax=Caulochytrium protostelioides TaxID=1555241 RepID=A0A4P9X3T5_9FUNG|nr:hypothetical protein CXG81DRAFT_20255 [Caulochytrium protostelioides]|eukprot:RKO99681.1 hypothetical protein CXG81DRAFT_20255 [Caulochytrium protostelioides]
MDNGHVQLMSRLDQKASVVIKTELQGIRAAWFPGGTCFVIAGTMHAKEGKKAGVAQFYTNQGQYIRSMRLPTTEITHVTFDPTGQRIVFAAGGTLYFALIRSSIPHGYIDNERTIFWKQDTSNALSRNIPGSVLYSCRLDTQVVQTSAFPKIILMTSSQSHLALLTEASRFSAAAHTSSGYCLSVVDASGSTLTMRTIPFCPSKIGMSSRSVYALSDHFVYEWEFMPQQNVTADEIGFGLSTKTQNHHEKHRERDQQFVPFGGQ